jgi:hypothetical protein
MDELPENLRQLMGMKGYVLSAQSTYVDITPSDQQSCVLRIHFGRSLRRSKLVGSFTDLSFTDQHPLCLPYEAQTARIAIHSGPKDADQFLTRLCLLIR